jgi:hypothetical protein
MLGHEVKEKPVRTQERRPGQPTSQRPIHRAPDGDAVLVQAAAAAVIHPSPAGSSCAMATAAARSVAAGVASTTLSSRLRARSRNTISFPQRPPSATVALSVSGSAPPAANPKHHNAKAYAGEEEVNGEELLRQFTREAARAGVVEEIRRRLRNEEVRDKRKRKARGWC